MCIRSSEQAIREIDLKPFEICVKEFKANGLMVSWNFLGATWTGKCSNRLNTVLVALEALVVSKYLKKAKNEQ